MNMIVSQRQIGETNLQFFRRILGDVVVDVAMHGHAEAYLAIKSLEGKIQACVCPINIKKKHIDCERSFSYEELEFVYIFESHNPRLANCPQRILNQLTPVDDLFERGTKPWRNATDWRNRSITNTKSKISRRKMVAA